MSTIDTTLKNKLRIVLNALLDGVPIEHGGYTYVMDEDYNLCIESQREKIEHGKLVSKDTVYLKTDYTIKDFVNIVNTIDGDYLFLLACNNVLNDTNMGRK